MGVPSVKAPPMGLSSVNVLALGWSGPSNSVPSVKTFLEGCPLSKPSERGALFQNPPNAPGCPLSKPS